jgi:hypothetical protein
MLIERFISAIIINSIIVHWRIPGVVGHLTMFLLLLLIHHEDGSVMIVIVIVRMRIRIVVIVHHDPGPDFRLAGASQRFSFGHEKGWG